MRVHSLHIGKIQKVNGANVSFETGMLKNSVEGELFCSKSGFEGDEISDTKHHGGEQKAVFANSLQNYEIWSKYLGKEMKIGFMGENLCIDGMDENSVHVGDVHKIGSIILQVSQPRKPCFKIAGVWDEKNFTKEIFKTGLTGWYYRVLSAGSCKAGDVVEVIEKDAANMSVMEVNQLFYAPKQNEHLLSKFKELKTIAPGWDKTVKERTDGIYDDSYMSQL
ncbi:hypothetical protein (MOSC domain) [Campylobacter iguaniorum]|uniref:MOSC domain-containing protein n=1 Tax=Campylobacter iguaniorum TaxID=1244531 RepID=A0A076FAN3_9BACT|nr:MOSC domain-containing protein [Campylobacter iguaniorum]AII15275.1 hypothetical protein (MOSC domain) [Campylobacter iguaniorum]